MLFPESVAKCRIRYSEASPSRSSPSTRFALKSSDSKIITKGEITDYRAQFEKWKAARQRITKFRASDPAKTKAKEKRQREDAGEEPPEQLNKTWDEFVKIILAPKRRKRIDGGRPGHLDYQRMMPRKGNLMSTTNIASPASLPA